MTKLVHGWLGSDLEARIGAHIQAWEAVKSSLHKRPLDKYPFITISREFGCEALPLARRLEEILNERCRPSMRWLAYDRELLDKVAEQLHVRRAIVDAIDERRRDEMSELFDNVINRKVTDALVMRTLAEVIRSLAIHGHAILVGRGSALVTQDLKMGLHVRLTAPRNWRTHSLATDRHLSQQEAARTIKEGERQRQHYLSTFFVIDPEHPFHPDLIIDNSRFNLAQIAEIVFSALGVRFGETLVSA